MRIILPDNLNDITLEKYQAFMQLDATAENYDQQIFSLFTGVDIEDIKNVAKKKYDEIITHICTAIGQQGEFERIITIDGIKLGIIPNFDKITAGEYTDLINYSSKEKDGYNPQLNRLIAVLYRPVVKEDKFNNYTIQKYKGTEKHLHLINKLPMATVTGVLGFFLTLSNELEAHIQVCTEEAQQRGQ